MNRGRENGAVLWTPPADVRETTQLGRFMDHVRDAGKGDFADYDELHRWSIDDLEGFWGSLWDFYEVKARTPYERVLGSREMPGAEWFTGSELNYAEHAVGADEDIDKVAIVARSQTRDDFELTFGDLREQVARARAGLQRLGVGRGGPRRRLPAERSPRHWSPSSPAPASARSGPPALPSSDHAA